MLALILGCGASENPEERAQRLGSELRCPVCRGVPISESPALLATEMMEVLRAEIASGKTDEEILRFFETRYGEWVLLKPKPEGANLLIWILPVLFLAGGGIFVYSLARGKPDAR